MRRLLRSLSAGLLLRRTAKDLAGIRAALERQADLLQRIVDHLVPPLEAPNDEELRVTTGIDRLNEHEIALAIAFEEKMRRDYGRSATDQEVLEMLSWEETRRQAGGGR